MKKRKSMFGLLLLVAVLALGIGYALISDIELKVGGTANVKANGEFEVAFDQTHTVVVTPADAKIDFDGDSTADNAVSAGAYTDEVNATMTVYLDTTNRTATAVYKIINNSPELGATVSADVTQFTGGKEEFLSVEKELYKEEACTTVLGNSILNSGDVAYLKVIVNLDKLPATDITEATFGVTITASPAAETE